MSDPAACPAPLRSDRVLLAHGGGGRATQQLLERVFLPAFANPALAARHDGAALELGGTRLAFTTDAYVVQPREFPGGDIGALAVHGTVNDLAMCGARPRWLSAAFVLEEGLPLAELERVVASMRAAAAAAGVELVTGDTKVVPRGQADGLYLTTAGVGEVVAPAPVLPARVAPGDAVLLSGDLARHGVAVLAERAGLRFNPPLLSDCAPLHEPVLALLAAGLDVHCLRDLTRGGLAAALVEVAQAAGRSLRVQEAAIPLEEGVRGACELLGLEPLELACEGRFVAFVPAAQAEAALALLRAHPVSAGATLLGEVRPGPAGEVRLVTRYGSERLLDLPSGEALPRIC